MRIIKATDPITVDHPVFLLFGQPGICKSSLGCSAKDPLLFDFDKGAHRAANRRDSLVIDVWADMVELMGHDSSLDPYHAVSVDTVGRCLDVMTAHLASTDMKKFPGGVPSQQGWTVLKKTFSTWLTQLRSKGKDVLLIAHDKEEKDGDTRVVRPDIVGGSYGEVMKNADFVGYVYMSGRDRILDFSPTDRWVGKNPAGWAPFKIPPVEKAGHFMADLFDQGRAALGKISEVSATIATQVDDWRAALEAFTAPEECTRAIAEIAKLPTVAQPQVKALLMARAVALGFTFDRKAKAFVEAEQPAGATA